MTGGGRTMDQDEVTRLRPARHFQADRIIRPYVRHEAEGAKTLLVRGRDLLPALGAASSVFRDIVETTAANTL